MEIRASLIEYKDKKCIQVLLNDVTEQLRAEENIRESHILLKKLTDNIPAAIYQFELSPKKDMSFPFVSKGIERLMPGIDMNEIRGMPLMHLTRCIPMTWK